MELVTIVSLAIGILIILFPVAFIWYFNVGSMLAAVKSRRAIKQVGKTPSNLTCSVDTDCPPGYVCLGGRCILQKAS
jgi:hypothetical protein